MVQWRQKFVAIRHAKSGDFGKFVEKAKKVAFSKPNLAILRYFWILILPGNFVSKISKFLFKNHLKLNFFYQNLAQLWRKVAILVQNLAKSGDFGFIFGEIVAVLKLEFA